MDDLPVRRREFVIGSLASAGAVLLGGLTASGATPRWGRPPTPTRANFSALIGSRFRLYSKDTSPAVVELTEVKPVAVTSAEHARRVSREPFSVLFRSERHSDLPQGTYVAVHPSLGAQQLLIVPVGPGRGYYEAIFS